MNFRRLDDLPAAKPQFEIARLAGALAEMLQWQGDSAFVLGIHGPWGSGKSTLLNAIQAGLPKTEIIIPFNAWKYQDKEALWRALILRVLAELRRNGGDAAKLEELERALYESFTATEQGKLQVNWTAAVTEAVQVLISLAGVGLGVGMLGSAGRFLGKWFGQKPDDASAEDTGKRIAAASGILQSETISRAVRRVESIEQFLKTFQELVAGLAKKSRIYVLIDDLDRCLPEAALEIFEAMKLFLDAPECVYVLAVDRAVIRRGLELRYPSAPAAAARVLPAIVDPDEYIEKTITLSIDMPLFSSADGLSLLQGVDPTGDCDTEEALRIIEVLGTNPRRLKRFGMMLAFWRRVARSFEPTEALGFSPLAVGNRALFVKVSLIGYLNSALFLQMQRDPDLPRRLQDVGNQNPDLGAPGGIAAIEKALANELPVVRQAALDTALWRVMAMEPGLNAHVPKTALALRWFRSLNL